MHRVSCGLLLCCLWLRSLHGFLVLAHAADDELTNEFLDELPTRVPAHAIAEVKWAKFDETRDRVLPPADVGSYAGEEIDWTVVREKKAAAAGAAAEGAKQNERIRLIVESERLAAEQARWSDSTYGSAAPSGSFILAPICLAVVSSVVVIAVLLVRNRGPYGVDGKGGDDGGDIGGHVREDDRRVRGSEGESILGETDGGSKGSDRDVESGDVRLGGIIGEGGDANRRSMDGAESSSVADSHSFANYGATKNHHHHHHHGGGRNSDAANLRGLMAGFGSRNTAMDRLIDDSRSDVAPSEAPSTVFEINPPRWVARMFGAGGPRDSGNSAVGVEEAAVAAALERGNSSRGESVFSAADFSDAVFNGASARDATFTSARLRRVEGKEALFDRSDLSEAKLGEALFTGAHFPSAILAEAKLGATDFTGAHLDEAVLTKARATGVKFVGAVLRGAKLREADLTEADDVPRERHPEDDGSSGVAEPPRRR